MGVALYSNLAVAVPAGVALQSILFAWQQGRTVTFRSVTTMSDPLQPGRRIRVVELEGPIFFGSSRDFYSLFEPMLLRLQRLARWRSRCLFQKEAAPAEGDYHDEGEAGPNGVARRRLSSAAGKCVCGFCKMAQPTDLDTDDDFSILELHFHMAEIVDYSGVEVINQLAHKFDCANVHVRMRFMKAECTRTVRKVGDLLTETMEVEYGGVFRAHRPHHLNVEKFDFAVPSTYLRDSPSPTYATFPRETELTARCAEEGGFVEGAGCSPRASGATGAVAGAQGDMEGLLSRGGKADGREVVAKAADEPAAAKNTPSAAEPAAPAAASTDPAAGFVEPADGAPAAAPADGAATENQ